MGLSCAAHLLEAPELRGLQRLYRHLAWLLEVPVPGGHERVMSDLARERQVVRGSCDLARERGDPQVK